MTVKPPASAVLAGKMGIEIGENEISHGAARLVRAAADMRSERDVVESEKRFRHTRLILEDIQRRATDRAAGKSFDKRLLIHQRTTRHIDEHTLGPRAFSTSALTIWRVSAVAAAAMISTSQLAASASMLS